MARPSLSVPLARPFRWVPSVVPGRSRPCVKLCMPMPAVKSRRTKSRPARRAHRSRRGIGPNAHDWFAEPAPMGLFRKEDNLSMHPRSDRRCGRSGRFPLTRGGATYRRLELGQGGVLCGELSWVRWWQAFPNPARSCRWPWMPSRGASGAAHGLTSDLFGNRAMGKNEGPLTRTGRLQEEKR